MGTLYDPSEDELDSWCIWLNSRPPKVRAVAEGLPPWNLYRLSTTGHRVELYSVDQQSDGVDVRLTVVVLRKWNPNFKPPITVERRVFGIKPEELEVCDPPKGASAPKIRGRVGSA